LINSKKHTSSRLLCTNAKSSIPLFDIMLSIDNISRAVKLTEGLLTWCDAYIYIWLYRLSIVLLCLFVEKGLSNYYIYGKNRKL